MKIEQLKDQDLPALAKLFKQFWGEESSLKKMTVSFRQIVSNPAYLLLVARQDAAVVGFVMGIICEELYGDCRPFLLIEDLIVDKNQRRQGVGAALLDELEKLALQHDCCQLILVTEADRQETLKFYKSSGYEYESYKGFKKKIGK